MSRTKFEIRKKLWINGVFVNMGIGNISPTLRMLEEIEACHVHGNPWQGFWVKDFKVKSVVNEKEVYARYDVKMVHQRASVG